MNTHWINTNNGTNIFHWYNRTVYNPYSINKLYNLWAATFKSNSVSADATQVALF